MNLKEAIIKKIDELILEGEQVHVIPSYDVGFEIGEIRAVYLNISEDSWYVLVRGTSMSLDEQDAAAIYNYLEGCYNERLEKENNRRIEAALEYLGIS